MNALRTIYRYWAAIVFVAVLVEVGAAGYGAFYSANHLKDKGDTFTHEGFEHGWDFHTGFGYIAILGMLILLALALAARLGRRRIWWTLALAVAGVVESVFAFLGDDHPAAGFLHPLNALVIFTLSGLIAHQAWRGSASA